MYKPKQLLQIFLLFIHVNLFYAEITLYYNLSFADFYH